MAWCTSIIPYSGGRRIRAQSWLTILYNKQENNNQGNVSKRPWVLSTPWHHTTYTASWYTPIISVLRRWEEQYQGVKDNLGCTASSMSAWDVWDPVSETMIKAKVTYMFNTGGHSSERGLVPESPTQAGKTKAKSSQDCLASASASPQTQRPLPLKDQVRLLRTV